MRQANRTTGDNAQEEEEQNQDDSTTDESIADENSHLGEFLWILWFVFIIMVPICISLTVRSYYPDDARARVNTMWVLTAAITVVMAFVHYNLRARFAKWQAVAVAIFELTGRQTTFDKSTLRGAIWFLPGGTLTLAIQETIEYNYIDNEHLQMRTAWVMLLIVFIATVVLHACLDQLCEVCQLPEGYVSMLQVHGRAASRHLGQETLSDRIEARADELMRVWDRRRRQMRQRQLQMVASRTLFPSPSVS